MNTLNIFVSHSSKYADLAQGLKRSLQALELNARLNIQISEEMAGATNWREWIENNVRGADVFLLIYPHVNMQMEWCNYELGRFYDEKRPVVCLKNIDIEKPPPAFEPYQAYTADEAGLRKFLDELFVTGAFTSGQPLNVEVGQVASEFFARAQGVARELAQKFAEARVREQLYERRITISLEYTSERFDPDRSTVQGNPEGMSLLGLRDEAAVPWSRMRAALGDDVDWPAALEQALPTISEGVLPPSLSPFRAFKEIYIPVIAKAESADNVLRNIVLIFVTVDGEELRPLLDWAIPRAMPDQLALLIRLLRMTFRARWDILEPSLRELMYGTPSKEQCASIVASVVAGYERMRRDAEREEVAGLDKFFDCFDRAFRPDIEAFLKEYEELMQAFAGSATESSQEIASHLERLLGNNARWLQIEAKQFLSSINDLLER